LTTSVHEAEKLSLEQIAAFLEASQEIRFEGETQEQVYHWIEQVLSQHEYPKQSRPSRGTVCPCKPMSCVAKSAGSRNGKARNNRRH